MTTVNMSAATYRPCPSCSAPIVSPFPDTWTFDLIKEGPREGPVESFGTPHRPECDAPEPDPQPGISVRVPGKHITKLDVSFGSSSWVR